MKSIALSLFLLLLLLLHSSAWRRARQKWPREVALSCISSFPAFTPIPTTQALALLAHKQLTDCLARSESSKHLDDQNSSSLGYKDPESSQALQQFWQELQVLPSAAPVTTAAPFFHRVGDKRIWKTSLRHQHQVRKLEEVGLDVDAVISNRLINELRDSLACLTLKPSELSREDEERRFELRRRLKSLASSLFHSGTERTEQSVPAAVLRGLRQDLLRYCLMREDLSLAAIALEGCSSYGLEDWVVVDRLLRLVRQRRRLTEGSALVRALPSDLFLDLRSPSSPQRALLDRIFCHGALILLEQSLSLFSRLREEAKEAKEEKKVLEEELRRCEVSLCRHLLLLQRCDSLPLPSNKEAFSADLVNILALAIGWQRVLTSSGAFYLLLQVSPESVSSQLSLSYQALVNCEK